MLPASPERRDVAGLLCRRAVVLQRTGDDADHGSGNEPTNDCRADPVTAVAVVVMIMARIDRDAPSATPLRDRKAERDDADTSE